MEPKALTTLIQTIIAAVEKRIPEYLAVEADRKLNDGNCALCIVDAAGGVHGKMFGTDKIRQRQCFRIAWTKASQVWITGYKTGEYEKLVFTGEVDEKQFGIIRPDFIGWIGGQPSLWMPKQSCRSGSAVFAAPATWRLSKRPLPM